MPSVCPLLNSSLTFLLFIIYCIIDDETENCAKLQDQRRLAPFPLITKYVRQTCDDLSRKILCTPPSYAEEKTLNDFKKI